MKHCPACGNEMTVKDSRPGPSGIRRRRECLNCGERVSTLEIPLSIARRLINGEAATHLRNSIGVLTSIAAALDGEEGTP